MKIKRWDILVLCKPKKIYPFRSIGIPPSSSIETPFPCLYTVLWVLGSCTDRQLLKYIYTIQQTDSIRIYCIFFGVNSLKVGLV